MFDGSSQPRAFTDAEISRHFAPFADRMLGVGMPELAIKTFGFYYERLLRGESGTLDRSEIAPVETVPDAEQLTSYQEAARMAIHKTVMIKLNGGLGTSMGLDSAKSLIVARDGLSFLDIIARHVLALRRTFGCTIPLVLMNSIGTHADSLALLKVYPGLEEDIPLGFVQHRVPKITRKSLRPAEWEPNPELEWCPPGHGDIFAALVSSGMLDNLLDRGYEFAFVSNGDNLGAVLNEQILGYFAHHHFPFMMEVADRTEADRKGGHLARLKDGRLALRESAQCPENERQEFQDIDLYRFFNTNNLWINLIALKRLLDQRGGVLGLPMIVNHKTVDPRDENSIPVFQLETAMGAAISAFPGAQALRVPRTRFAPVKTCEDLLGIRSDAFILTDDFRVVPNPARNLGPVVIHLDPRFYTRIDDFEARFPRGVPSLLDCERLSIEGDVRFGSEVVVRGQVHILNQALEQMIVADGIILIGDVVH